MRYLLVTYLQPEDKNQVKLSLNSSKNFGNSARTAISIFFTAEQYREELGRDSFINGIASPLIRQRLLENTRLDLKIAFDQANSLVLAQKNFEAYAMPSIPVTVAVSNSPTDQHTEIPMQKDHSLAATYAPKKKCYFCGDSIHNRRSCPARDATCRNCGKKGTFRKGMHVGSQCKYNGCSVLTYDLLNHSCVSKQLIPGFCECIRLWKHSVSTHRLGKL